MKAGSVNLAIEQLRADHAIILLDDVGATPQSYVVMPAESATEGKISWLINHARGILFVAISDAEASERGLSPLYSDSSTDFRFGPSVEAREGVRSGISALDRATTVLSLCEASFSNKSIVSPGHVFPLIARKGGLLVSYGVPEAVIDLLKVSKKKELGILMHLLAEDGEHYSPDKLEQLAKSEKLPIVKLSEVAKLLLINEPLVKKEAETKIPTRDFGGLVAHGFRSLHDQLEHIAFTYNHESFSGKSVLTRMHSEKKLGDIFNLSPKGGREKLRSSLQEIKAEGGGAFVYIRKSNFKTSSEELADKFESKVKIQELRELGVGAQILQALNIKSIKLITSSNSIVPDLSAFNICVEKRGEA